MLYTACMNRRYSLPARVYALVEQIPGTVLLEDGKPDHPRANEQPWTRLFTSPMCVYAAYRPAEIAGIFAAIESAVAAGLCAAGFFSYECGNCFEPRASMRAGRAGLPLAWFGIYRRCCIFDHGTGRFVESEPPELTRIGGSQTAGSEAAAAEPQMMAEFPLTEAGYARRIAAVHEWIRAGDVYQLNFTAPLQVQAFGSAAALYARLRARQPVPYGAFLHWQPGCRILSFSPELFFRVESAGGVRRIITRPMKGTAPRGRTTREDREIAERLRNDPKNRSENVMIVDLVRNDLGRLAHFGTVRTEEIFAVERYPTLWQMTSTVSAELRPEVSYYDIFRALFPCGSVTGAPKIRAMQLIAGLEDAPRGVYTGAIGFFARQQTVFNVAIRTLELEDGRGTMGAGSGIVIDSDPAEEFRECLLKAKFLTGTAHCSPACGGRQADFSLIETALWDGGCALLEMHFDRLEDSAEYFDFPCDRAAVKAAWEAHVCGFEKEKPHRPRRVRMLLGAGGEFEITSEILPSRDGPGRRGRVLIAKERTDPADPMLYHKTTHRPLYAEAFAQAVRGGFDDVLFMNLRGEVTEGAISNVFVVNDGRWFTPPVECGLLAGVYRRHLLATRPEIEERVLYLDDLRTASAVYLTNAVRGLRCAGIEWDDLCSLKPNP
jgi:para-aminobenzoate synthetase/4-amino-4-deoxychorismate lyase